MSMVTIIMPTETTPLALPRLLQLVSPSLPIGAYTYSQGIEWAVEEGWIRSGEDLFDWLSGLMRNSLAHLELPVILRMLQAWRNRDQDAIRRWNTYLLASRETRELRLEESNRARALTRVLLPLEPTAGEYEELLRQTQHAGFSYACHAWSIENDDAVTGLVWSWLENLVLAAVKSIPLGQSEGQQVMFKLAGQIPELVQCAADLADDEIGASSMALAIASSRHETLYTRLFRS